ncbi:hypothetical protein RJ641_003964 [Dillenia turbinata]|uniref:RING-type domain-containing protein n=1 Tax=Dillenia turbinata TaxID=194707 RepID=A0AAN8V972_9MAGN
MSRVVQVKREKLEACMSCGICDKLVKDATTITECLHTFCKKCIYDKITEEELNCCPLCDTDLGTSPLDKLRPDHAWNDILSKIFGQAKISTKEPEVVQPDSVPPEPLPSRRKERSLSSLVVSTPRVSAQTGRGRRRRSTLARKVYAEQDPASSEEENVKKVEEYCWRQRNAKKVEDCHGRNGKKDEQYPEGSLKTEDNSETKSLLELVCRTTQNRRKNSSAREPSKQRLPNKVVKDSAKPSNEKLKEHMLSPKKENINGEGQYKKQVDLWRPLTHLVDAASNSKPSKLDLQTPKFKSAPLSTRDTKETEPKGKGWLHPSEVHDEENGSAFASSNATTLRKLKGSRRRKAATSENFVIPAQTLVEAMDPRSSRKFRPVWFSLLASDTQEGDAPLPQISSCYLRVKDGDLPVSYIKRYIMKKLDLTSEAEVEITLCGCPVMSSLQLSKLVEVWSDAIPASSSIESPPGGTAKDFVMELCYGRKALPA